MRCSSYDECDGHGLLLSDLLALPAAASARTSTCSVLNVKTVVTASINTRPQDGCWSPAHAFQMVAAAVAYLLRSVDVGAQAPTQFLDAISGQDGRAAILRSALREDTEDTGCFFVVECRINTNTRTYSHP